MNELAFLEKKLINYGYNSIIDIFKDNKFQKSIKKVSKELSNKYPIDDSHINSLFMQKEVSKELFKILFVKADINILNLTNEIDVDTLPSNFLTEFIKNLKDELLKDGEFNKIFADNELYEATLNIKSNLENIAENIKIIKNTLLKEYEFNFEQYKQALLNNIKTVHNIGLGIKSNITKRPRKELNNIYVKPSFLYSKINDKTMSKIDIDEDDNFKNLFDFDVEKNIVILGNPGAGKSILTKYIIYLILNEEYQEFSNKEVFKFLPFRVELRKYHSFKSSKEGNILQYISSTLTKEYGLKTINEYSIENILTSMNSLILFDGFDEIFDIEDKINIKNDIENFARLYDKSKVIVTSRFIGYDEDVKLSDNFFEMSIKNFNDEQIEEYVRSWYNTEEIDEHTREEEVKEFLSKKDELDRELISNPLLLSLIVLLYRNNLKLPESKLEIYESCTKTLVDKWDDNKKLQIDIPEELKTKKESIFANIAFWQYENKSEEIKVTHKQTNFHVAKTLQELEVTKDFNEAERLAEKFMVYAEKRSIYFDNAFTHKTFWEYYTALWIYQNYELEHEIEKRDELISKYIDNPFWFIVLELLISLIDESAGTNKPINKLVNKQLEINNYETYLFFLRLVPNIKNISEELKYDIIEKSMAFCIEKISEKFFNTFQKFANNKNLIELMQKNYNSLFEKYENNDEMLLNYFMFSYEISALTNNKISLTINNKQKLEKFKNSNSLVYSLDEGIIKVNSIDFTIKFGFINLLFAHKLLYLSFAHWSSIVNNINEFEKYLNYLNNLSKDKFYKCISIIFNDLIEFDIIDIDINDYSYINEISIEDIVTLINKFQNIEIATILLLMLYQVLKIKRDSENEIENIQNEKYREVAKDILSEKIKESREILKILKVEYLL